MFASDDLEILDVVNAEDEVIGQVTRGDMMSLADKPDQFLRAVEIFLQRPDGAIYLPRRSKEKSIAPGGYDLSAAGHVNSGESYSEACVREVKEELGIDVSINDIKFVKRVNPTPDLFYFRMIYLLQTDKEPALSPEHTDFSWIQPDRLEEVVRNDVPTKDTLYEDIPILVDFLYRESIA
jgi:isopentenyl-diphosphate delta-isomerase